MGGRTVAELRLPWGTPHVDAHHAGSIVAQVLAIRDRLDERCRFLTHLLGSCDWAIPKARPCPRQRLRIERQVVIPASSVGHTRRVERMGMHANQPVRFKWLEATSAAAHASHDSDRLGGLALQWLEAASAVAHASSAPRNYDLALVGELLEPASECSDFLELSNIGEVATVEEDVTVGNVFERGADGHLLALV